jgi:hypothetical protein
MALGDVTGTSSAASSSSMTGNAITAVAQSNSATNAINLTVTELRSAAAGVSSYQNSLAAVNASVGPDTNSSSAGLFAVTTADVTQGSITLSGNTASALAGMNEAFNTLTVSGANLLARGLAVTAPTVGSPVSVGADFVVMNTQTAVGSAESALNAGASGLTASGAFSAGSVTVNGNAALSMSNDPTVADSNKLLFTSLSSTNSAGNGVFMSGVDGTLNVTGSGIAVASPTGTGVVIQNTQTGLDVSVPGTVSVTNAAGDGISLLNANDSSAATVFFNSISVTTNAGAGLTVTNSTIPAAVNGLVRINDGTINATGGPAINATNANLAVSLATVVSGSSATNGISLVGCDNVLGTYPALVIGKTTITSPSINGIYLKDNVPQVAGGGSFADFGTLSITGAGQNGLFVENTNASFNFATIANSGNNAVQLVANAGEITTFLMQNSILNGAGNTGVNIQANSGTVNASVLNNQIKATGNSVTGLIGGSGATLAIDMTNNAGVGAPTPTGSVSLTNTAGNTLDVSQSAGVLPAPPGPYTALEAAISAANNGVSVTIVNPVGGTVNQGVIVPTP